jgi:hypothetical protein
MGNPWQKTNSAWKRSRVDRAPSTSLPARSNPPAAQHDLFATLSPPLPDLLDLQHDITQFVTALGDKNVWC